MHKRVNQIKDMLFYLFLMERGRTEEGRGFRPRIGLKYFIEEDSLVDE